MTLEEVQHELEHAATLLADARSALHDGEDFDIGPFNDVLTNACRNAVRLPADEAMQVKDTLRTLLDGLENLRTEVVAVEGAIREHAEAAQKAAVSAAAAGTAPDDGDAEPQG